MKKAVLYARTSTPEQHLETQFLQLREIAAQRGFEIVAECSDRGISGSKAKRPGIDSLLRDARRGKFAVILVAAFDRLARSTRNFLDIVDELDSLGIELISAREAVDTSTPTGRMFVTLLGSIAELERSFIRERIKCGMRRRKMEGLPVGRQPLDVDHDAIVRDRLSGLSLTSTAKKYGISRASVVRFVREAQRKQPTVIASVSGCHEFAEECAA
jgi:DNA invertase Pin-like site-specific DNA recombinase